MKAVHKKNIIKNFVEKIRIEKGMEREALAKKIKITSAALWQIERGAGMRLSTLIKIANVLDVTLDELIKR